MIDITLLHISKHSMTS